MRRRVFGIQPAREAIAVHGGALGRVLIEGRSGGAEQLDALARYARDRGATVTRVDRAILDQLAKGERHQGVVVEAPPLHLVPVDALLAPRTSASGSTWSPLVLTLDELTDPQNFGAIVRSAVALGATGVLWSEDKSAPLSPAMTRASAGAVEHATLCRVRSLSGALAAMIERDIVVVALDAAATTPIDRIDLTGPIALVVGAEGRGLRRSTRRACTVGAHLPMRGPIAALNASVSVAIALYEAVRQRSRHGPEPASEVAGAAPADRVSSPPRDMDDDEDDEDDVRNDG